MTINPKQKTARTNLITFLIIGLFLGAFLLQQQQQQQIQKHDNKLFINKFTEALARLAK